jgi:hypothetical protein
MLRDEEVVTLRIAIVTFGSRGDVQPYVALGLGLKHAGHSVRLVTQRDCESLVKDYGLDYGAVAGDVRALMESDVGQQAINTAPNPLRFGWSAMKLVQPLLRQMAIDCLAACEESDVLLCLSMFWDSNVQKVYPLEMFTSESQLVDKQLGTVTHYTIASQVQYPENNTAIVTLTTTCSGGVSQTVQLRLQQVGSVWKITSSEAHNV